MKAVLLLLAGVGLALSGCAAGPNYHTPKPDTPPAFVASTAANGAAANRAAKATTLAPDLATWWHALNDPELDSLVERAIKSNPDLEIALTRLQQARTYEAVVVGHALPEVDASAAAGRGTGSDLTRGRAEQGLRSADNASGLQHINTIAGFDAVWELDVFGKYRREFEAARYDAQAAAAARAACCGNRCAS
jgi:outer membrane protein TolC